jgi:hypothetical protein
MVKQQPHPSPPHPSLFIKEFFMKRRVCTAGILGMILALRLIAQNAESDFKTDRKGTLLAYQGKSEQVVIPSQIGGKPLQAIGREAFKSSDLTAVTIPNTVTAIGERAFASNHLTSLTIPSSVSIGGYAFSNNKLTRLTIGSNVSMGAQGCQSPNLPGVAGSGVVYRLVNAGAPVWGEGSGVSLLFLNLLLLVPHPSPLIPRS